MHDREMKEAYCMKNKARHQRGKTNLFWQVLTACLLFFFGSTAVFVPTSSSHTGDPAEYSGSLNIPSQYGEIVYTKPGHGKKHVYIIFQSHRSSLTGLNNSDTVQAQADIYRVQEWIVRNENVQLLLPEGFFSKKSTKSREQSSNANDASFNNEKVTVHSLDDESLQKRLRNTKEFVNADKLLYQSSNIRIQQIEDRELYFKVRGFLSELMEKDSMESDQKKSELVSLQRKRSATLLQRMPEIIEKEYKKGRIQSRKAIFTIGIAHAGDIIGFIKDSNVTLFADGKTTKQHKEELKLAAKGYHVTLIMPASLMSQAHSFEFDLPGV